MKRFSKQLVGEFQRSRKGDGEWVVLEGLHAVKHARRFGAKFECILTPDKKTLLGLTEKLATAPEVEFLHKFAEEISPEDFAHLSPVSIGTGVAALARKPEKVDFTQIVDNKPIVFIQNPRNINNAGAVVRVSAGFGVAAATSGSVNLWHAEAVRAGAGLQFALPVARIDEREFAQIFRNRQIVACDAEGENMYEAQISPEAVLVFGTERSGITPEMKAQADRTIAIPMQPQVSSLNLATSVAAVLYGAMYRLVK